MPHTGWNFLRNFVLACSGFNLIFTWFPRHSTSPLPASTFPSASVCIWWWSRFRFINLLDVRPISWLRVACLMLLLRCIFACAACLRGLHSQPQQCGWFCSFCATPFNPSVPFLLINIFLVCGFMRLKDHTYYLKKDYPFSSLGFVLK